MASLPNPWGQAYDKIATTIVDYWLAELGIKTKFETASQICNYFKTGMIDGKKAIQLIRQLGYTQRQALRMISLCYLRKIPKTLQTFPQPGTKEYQQMEDAING